MREVLFRGKRIDNGEWIYGGLLTPTDIMDVWEISENTGMGDRYEIDPDTIGQYTGLKDKNGKKVFEGDIVYARGYSEKFVYAKVNIGKFSGGCETCCCTAGNYMGVFLEFSNGYEENILSDFFDDIEVVNNIHDNPELMENL